MKKLDVTTLKDKIIGCWEGKNIGGVLGAPFEMYRGLVDVDFYTQDLSKGVPPNDDLDLQLIWLNACEKWGKAVNADILAEYWLCYEVGNCSEYGIAKQNLTWGLKPPLSGVVGNHFKDSNGAFIRSEIWACLFPGNPDQAVRYAYEDAIVDHSGEGVYAQTFCTAVESAAFFESDINVLIDIGLSYLPKDCAVYSAICMVREMYNAGKTVEEIRVKLLTDYPSYFGIYRSHPWEVKEDFPLGDNYGFDAPVQLGIVTAALLFSQGDFEKAIITAVHCGEDADCTAATVGAIMGIISGGAGLPDKWKQPLGHKIETVFINKTLCLPIPETTDELTDRVMRLLPVFNDGAHLVLENDSFVVYANEQQYNDDRDAYFRGNYGQEPMKICDLLKMSPYKKIYKNIIFDTIIDYGKDPYVKVGEKVKLKATLMNQNFGHVKYCICVKVMVDDGVELNTSKYFREMVCNSYEAKTDVDIEFTVKEAIKPYVDIYLDITVEGRPIDQLIKCRYYLK